MKVLKYAVIALVLFLALAQLIPIDQSNPEIRPEAEFLTQVEVSDEVVQLLKTACYDCHSNETVWPDYSKYAPVSWIVYHHVDEGREHVNFSEWSEYSPRAKDHILKECIEELEDDKMPLSDYVLMHPEASLDAQEKQLLMDFFQRLRAEKN